MGIIVRPEVSFFFSVMDAQENDRDQVKSDLKTKIKLIDPIPIDPAGTVRYKWDSLLPVHADPQGEIQNVTQMLQNQVDALQVNDPNTVGALTEWCYLVRGGEIYCYHCYALQDKNGPVTVRVGGSDVRLSVAYSWASPF
ncbi:MAG: hypothetical protein IID28_00140 [Planctomycetes bacterium]|nr:hypothetical protein [Planctomycetota bacterium]